jgi:hypothetical protein
MRVIDKGNFLVDCLDFLPTTKSENPSADTKKSTRWKSKANAAKKYRACEDLEI